MINTVQFFVYNTITLYILQSCYYILVTAIMMHYKKATTFNRYRKNFCSPEASEAFMNNTESEKKLITDRIFSAKNMQTKINRMAAVINELEKNTRPTVHTCNNRLRSH